MNDADAERILDRRIMRRLDTDRAYRHAENAEDQARREQQITEDEERRLDRERARHDLQHDYPDDA
jgi:hypothetical protein